MKENYITHLYFLIDASGSMQKHAHNVRKVLDSQIKHWSIRAKELDQTVRASIYFFNETVKCICYDKDISQISNLGKEYNPSGNTAFIDANLEAINDGLKIPEKYGNHSHLLICLSDGENNINNNKKDLLKDTNAKLPENWTVSCLVPNANGVHEAKYFGFPAQNIQVWDCHSDEGFEEMTKTIAYASDSYLSARSSGLRSTKSLFNLDASKLDKKEVLKNLAELQPYEYELLNVNKESYIKDFIESWKINFRKGANYYEITKPELIQNYKQLLIQDKLNGKIFGGENARKMLNLPNYEVKVNPSDYGRFRIFAQSTSSNRKLVKGTQLIVLK